MKRFLVFFAVTICLSFAFAQNINVSNITGLQSAINSAISGDTIVLADGTYINNNINISINNITIKSSTSGGVFLNGTNAININGNNIRFEGFQFTSGSITGSIITINGNNNNLSQLNFNGYSAVHMIMILGQNNIVENCNFQNKPALNMSNHGGDGDMIQIIPNSTNIGYNTIRYCSFQHMPGFGGDYGNECIRIGDGAYSTYISRTVVEHCYFEDTGNGDSEAISVKSRENCLRYNTMYNNPNAMFSFRNGDNNVAYSNFFIKSGGIRCKQSNNIFCYNNYFEQSGVNQNSSLPGTGTAPIYLEYFGNGYGSNFNIIHNTFYRCSKVVINDKLNNCTWANNILYSDSSTIFSGSATGQSFSGNIYQGTLGLSIPSGLNNSNPLLLKKPDGYYSITANSPAIGLASTNYPAIFGINGLDNDTTLAFDISGKTRPAAASLKDVGCNQYSSEIATNRPLTLCDVGPRYLCSITTTISGYDKNINFAEIIPNPSNGLFKILLPTTYCKVVITNSLGKTVYKTTAINNFIDIQINEIGVYFILICSEQGVTTKKVIITK